MPSPPEVIAHRGANREAAENTVAAFEIALDLGADGIELDVHLTADGVPVVHHDPLLTRGNSRSGIPIARLALAAVQRGTSVPTLDEVLAQVAGRCRLYVEIKAARALEATLERLSPLGESAAVHSFDHRIIARAAVLEPAVPRGVLAVSYLVDPVAAMQAAAARDLWQQDDLLDADLVRRVHAAGGRVIAWTVNDPGRAQELLSTGIDGICTDATRETRSFVDRATHGR